MVVVVGSMFFCCFIGVLVAWYCKQKAKKNKKLRAKRRLRQGLTDEGRTHVQAADDMNKIDSQLDGYESEDDEGCCW